MENQAYLFIIFILNGFLISILFDLFRILRKSFKTTDFITYIEDIIFWILATLIILYSIFKFSNGELRAYIFIGIALGIVIYMLLFSKIFIKINLRIINVLKSLIDFLIIKPIKFIIKLLEKLLLRPLRFIINKIKKMLSVFKLSFKSLFYKKKKEESKKDFI